MTDVPVISSTTELDTLLRQDKVMLFAHIDRIPKKIEKAVRSIMDESDALTVATLDVSDDADSRAALELGDQSAVTLLVYEDGDRVGFLYRPKPKEIYDYVAFLISNGMQPEDRTPDDKPKVPGQTQGNNAPTKPVHVTEASFNKVVLQSKEPVLVDMWAEWCAPCRMIAPVLDQLAGEMTGRVRIAKVDIDSNQGLAQKYGVRSIPTLLIFKNGKEVDRLVGALPAPAIRQRLEKWA